MISFKPISSRYQWLTGLAALFFLLLALVDFSQRITPAAVKNFSPAAKPDPFSALTVEAASALVYDLNQKQILFAKNPDQPLPIASLTKVMTALAAVDILPPETTINFIGRAWRLPTLVDYTLVSSSNAAAAAIARTAEEVMAEPLVDRMNALARELDLEATRFTNATGLDLTESEPSAISTARDIARLFAQILSRQPELLAATSLADFEPVAVDGIRYHLTNTNLAAKEIPGLIASKTGYTASGGGSVAVVFDRGLNQPIIIVVLGSTEPGRFQDLQKIWLATIQYFL
ncbi:MAG: D-alanyl-D-alanine carboxypeptidase [Candidatus Vogelbacteria bacterium]|nr:D-alanyl-D-alanine carboxypeptidase [Candidatus Vogelbacteria bacterium]